MNILETIQNLLGIGDLNDRIDGLETRIDALESYVDGELSDVREQIDQYGRYRHQDEETLRDMQASIEAMLDTVCEITERLENVEEWQKAEDSKRLESRLRNNLTRVETALAA